ncbi:MAG: hypothetical protein VKL59_25020 [Nostocaceae cyanobacterium]|nr:hypothetical protein [Nostocaceae cyanobacterium]
MTTQIVPQDQNGSRPSEPHLQPPTLESPPVKRKSKLGKFIVGGVAIAGIATSVLAVNSYLALLEVEPPRTRSQVQPGNQIAEHCHRMGFMVAGEMVAQGSPSQIKAEQPGQLIEVLID